MSLRQINRESGPPATGKVGICFVAFYLVLFAIIYRRVLLVVNESFIVGPDWRGLPFSMRWGVEKVLYGWSDFYMGTSFPYNIDQAIFSFLGSVNGTLISNILFLIPLPLAAYTMYSFVKKQVGSMNAAFVSSLLYVINPLIMNRTFNVGVSVLWPYALVPMFFQILTRLLSQVPITLDKLAQRDSLSLGVIFLIIFVFRPQFIYVIALVATGLLIIYLYDAIALFRNDRIKGKRASLIVNPLVCFLLFIAITAVGTCPYLIRTLTSSIGSKSIGDAHEVIYLFSFATLTNALRLVGEPGYYNAIFNYFFSPLHIIIGLSVPAFFMVMPLFRRKFISRTIQWYLSLILILLPYVLYAIHPIYFSITLASNTYLYALRNPDKIMFALSFVSSTLMGFGYTALTDMFDNNMKRKSVIKYQPAVIVLIVVTLVLINNYPVLLTDVYDPSYQKMIFNTFFLDPRDFNVYFQYVSPSDYYRILILPFTYRIETATRSVLSSYRVVNVPPDTFSAEKGAIFYWDEIADIILKGEDVAEKLSLGGVRYVIIDKRERGVADEWGYIEPLSKRISLLGWENRKGIIGNYLYLNPDDLIKYMAGQRFFRKVAENSQLSIYENLLFRGYIYNVGVKNTTILNLDITYPGKYDFELEMEEPGYLGMAIPYNDNFIAEVNGTRTPLFMSESGLTSLYVEAKGHLTISIYYRYQTMIYYILRSSLLISLILFVYLFYLKTELRRRSPMYKA